MQLTKLAHACVRLDKDGEVLVIDPGAFGGADALDGANAVLVTHEHFDHVEPDTLRAAMTASPGLRLWAAASVADQFADFGDRVSAVQHGDDFTAAGFTVHVYGEHHAIIHPDIPGVANVGFLVDGEVFHPGDSYTVPEDPVNTLLVPISGPWYSTREMIDYVRAVAPRRTYAIHDALLSPIGLNVAEMFAGLAAGPNNATYTWVEPGSTVDL
jgi:L-ascorbate metabolism protein UlaG (beta-lactamase superfamily)